MTAWQQCCQLNSQTSPGATCAVSVQPFCTKSLMAQLAAIYTTSSRSPTLLAAVISRLHMDLFATASNGNVVGQHFLYLSTWYSSSMGEISAAFRCLFFHASDFSLRFL